MKIDWRIGILSCLLLASCSGESPDSAMSALMGKYRLLEGSHFNSRGRHAEAISAYLAALDHRDAAPYGEYGLGVIYLNLDEGEAALARYAAAEAALDDLPSEEHGELRYRIQYNRGIVHFEAGDYGAAAAAFRKALETDNRRVEAKRNLELSLLSLNQKDSIVAPGNEDDPGEDDNPSLFEYIRRKEQDTWKSAEWIEENVDTGLDY